MFFYELHEGDDELFADVLLARDEEMSPDVFFETVQAIRRRIQDTFEEDTLIEAIAEELERDHGFIFISDQRLTAAINVSSIEKANFLADIDNGYDDVDDEEDVGADLEDDAEYLTIVAEVRGDAGPPPN